MSDDQADQGKLFLEDLMHMLGEVPGGGRQRRITQVRLTLDLNRSYARSRSGDALPGDAGHGDDEHASGARLIPHFDGSTMRLNGLLHDGEPEPQATPILAALHVRLEEIVRRSVRKPATGILHFHYGPIFPAPATDHDGAARTAKLDGVADEVRRNGMQEPPIPFDDQSVLYVERKPDAFVLRFRFEFLGGLGQHVLQHQPLPTYFDAARLLSGENLIYKFEELCEVSVEHFH